MPNETQRRFLAEIRHHLSGLREKIVSDFSEEEFDRELAALDSDPVYSKFALNCPEYVLVRFMGRISISIGRRLGEIYDKIPRFVAAARFSLTPAQVAPKFHGLELDVCLPFDRISSQDKEHVKAIVNRYLNLQPARNGVGIEIRYNFNPNDSSRLRKDVNMAEHLTENNLLPVYLIYSSISPRDEAIARLTRAGWKFLIGDTALSFSRDLLGFDSNAILETDAIRAEIRSEMQGILQEIFTSHAFSAAVRNQGNT
ncbi:MAG TPA: hypothetical protein PLY73_00180 [Candidatus Ozemobacteraceae bacterium]|nr:hypothetical protein [Candidatus Ozemobacteraceae bacterium]